MTEQSYQEVSRVILEELMVNPVDFRKKNPHIYFYNLKLENPEKYERLTFDTNGYEPYCKDLTSKRFLKTGGVTFIKYLSFLDLLT